MKTITKTPEETIKLGKKIAQKLTEGATVALYGNLGSGKTHLIKGIGLGLKVKTIINSPTFTLINEYQGKFPLYHFDLYRINSVDEAYLLGIEEYFNNKGIVVIEWAERITEILPENSIKIELKFINREKRAIKIKGLPL